MQKGRSAWTPTESTYNHYIQLDLGDRKKVKKIATLGRGKEMVTEYVIQFSDNGELWRTYTETSGQDQVEILVLIDSINYTTNIITLINFS